MHRREKYFFTSESVTEAHPDKLCDKISDALLDALLKDDPMSRAGIETVTKTGIVFVTGEITTNTYVDMQKVVRETIREIGYDDPSYGFDADGCGVILAISEQSPDIAQGVNEQAAEGKDSSEQGAGDQGMMFGYASNETPEFMPLPIMLAHKLVMKLSDVRRKKELTYLRPDGKSQVTIEYNKGKPLRCDAIVVSTQHADSVSHEQIKKDIIKHVIEPVCGKWLDDKTKYYVNPTGKFVIGGPVADSGLTGRKIIVDTYGGHGSHGGGAFSGKDPSKVDRSATYMARHIAKNIVAAELADKCEVQLSYAIGVAEPVSVLVHCFGTNRLDEQKLEEIVKKVFPLKPAGIIEYLDLRKPIFKKTAAFGHFGRNEPEFTWEKINKVEELKELAKPLIKPELKGEEVPLDGK
ncbi:MAG: methionine adenosyltransferase [Candidatus Diapherotrites archaeon]|nr:methionine adenosyltransferase [Candidatus Diapherotrites archaeon]